MSYGTIYTWKCPTINYLFYFVSTHWQEELQNSALSCYPPYTWSAKRAAISIGLYAPLIPVCTVTTGGEAIFHENEQMIVHFVISSSNITYLFVLILYGNKLILFIYLSHRYPAYNVQKPLNRPIYMYVLLTILGRLLYIVSYIETVEGGRCVLAHSVQKLNVDPGPGFFLSVLYQMYQIRN